MAASTRSSAMPRRRNCRYTIRRRSAAQSGIITANFIIALMAHQITLIPGDGIGPEVAEATVRAVEATGVAVEWDRVDAGLHALAEYGQLIPDDVFASLEATRVGLKGPTATPIAGGHQSINVALRKKLGLYTNFRPVRMLPGLKTRFHDLPLDMAIFRENTEDLYSGLEHEVIPGVVESLKIITQNASLRIARAAFEYARRERRRKVTAIHKANIMKMSDGLFLKCCRETAAHFREIQYDELIVDNACMQLVMRPETFDLLVLPNLYGDIISDLAAGLVGGLGIVPGANIGDHHAIFEAVHGTAPDIAGKGLANPTALMQSAVLMLAHLGERTAAARLQSAIERVYAEWKAPHRRRGRQGRYRGIHGRRDSGVIASRGVLPLPGPAQPQRANALVQVGPLHAQRPRGAGDVPVGFFQRAQDVLALGRFAGFLNGRFRAGSRAARGSPPESSRASAARPASGSPCARSRCAARARCPARRSFPAAGNTDLVQRLRLEIVARAEILQEVFGQQPDIVRALAQRRHADGHHAQPVIQVLAELLLRHHGAPGRGWWPRSRARSRG